MRTSRAHEVRSAFAKFDQKLILFAQRGRPTALTQILKVFTYSGTGPAWLIITAVLWALTLAQIFFIPAQARFLNALLATLIAWGISKVLKKYFSRKRPIHHTADLKPLISTPTCGSFPSGHSATTSSLFFALLLTAHPLTAWIGAWATLVSFSRLYLGVHYPTDILGGWIIGFASAWIYLAFIF